MSKVITKADLAKHNTKEDLWVAIHGKVYDVSPYREEHPGGVDSLLEVAGQDSTEAFEDVGHTPDARETMNRYLIGDLEGGEDEDAAPPKIERHLPDASAAQAAAKDAHSGIHLKSTHLAILSASVFAGFGIMRLHDHSQHPHLVNASLFSGAVPLASVAIATSLAAMALIHFTHPAPKFKGLPAHIKVTNEVARPTARNHAILDPRQFAELPITSIKKLSPNVKKFVLSLPRSNDVLGLPIGQHISIRGEIDGKPVNRSYTPTSSNRDRGRLELVIKMYSDGQLTGGYLDALKVGEKMNISGPRGQMRYRKGMADNIGMLAGGTGITPMYQLIRAICDDPTDQTSVTLIYANNSVDDILLKDELDAFAKKNPKQFHVRYFLSKPPAEWDGGVGRCSLETLKESFAPPAPKNKALLCGPPGMVDAAKGWLVDLGYDKPKAVSKIDDQVFCF